MRFYQFLILTYKVQLSYTTNSTVPLLNIAIKGLESIFKEGVAYKKAGVLAPELLPEGIYVQDLFTECENPKYQQLSTVIDRINSKYGKNQVFHGTLGTKRDWLPKDLLKSFCYTTRYDQLLKVN